MMIAPSNKSISIAFVPSKTGKVTESHASVPWGYLVEHLEQAAIGEKDGTGWLPALIEPGSRSAERVQAVTALVLDVEAETKRDPATGIKTAIGPEPPEVAEMVAELDLVGWTYLLHTTHSHLDPEILPAGEDHPRYRLVFALSRPLKPDEVKPLGHHVASVLGISDAFDRGTVEPSRFSYLPRVPESRVGAFEFHRGDGEPLDVNALLSDARRAEKALQAAAKRRPAPRSASVIKAFNDGHEIAPILEAAGYLPRGRRRWMHPESTTGMPGVRMLPESDPPRVFSSHGGDPLADGKAHDAFDCYRILVHGGDNRAAVKAAAEMLGMNSRRNDPKPDPEPVDDLDAAVQDLAKLSALEYDRVREAKAKTLGVRVATLDKEVGKARVVIAEEESESVIEEISPYPDPVIGIELLDEIERLYRRHCVMSEVDYTVMTGLALGTFVFDAFSVYPKVLLRSPEKRCGKTVTLEVSEAAVYRGLMASSITAAATFRIIDAHHPTLIIDEADTFLTANEEMRGVVNSSHRRRNAFVIRTEKQGEKFETKRFTTWAPMYIAGIGSQADTIEDRSIVIDLRRKLPGERVLKCPVDLFERTRTLRSRCLRWAEDHMDKLRRSDFEVPPCGNDRAADNWFPLLAIAKLIGEPWESRLMSAYVEKNHQGEDEAAGVMLLRDIRQIFDDQRKTRMHAEDLVEALVDLPDRPWEEWKHGKPMTKTSLSRLLKPYKIKSKQLRIGHNNRNGYEADQFTDAWARYTDPSLSDPPVQNSTTLHPLHGAGSSGFQNPTPDPSVEFSNPRKPSNGAGCRGVEVSEGGSTERTCSRCGGEGCAYCQEIPW